MDFIESKMKLVLWGSGQRARRFIQFFGAEGVVAVIESDVEKIGTSFSGKAIIDFDTYKRKYVELPIVITPYSFESIIQLLCEAGIDHYFMFEECPYEIWYTYGKREGIDQCIKELSEKNSYLIYGMTVFSCYLYLKLRNMGAEVFLATGKTRSSVLVNLMESQLHTQFIANINEVEKNHIDYVIWSSAERDSELEDCFTDRQMIEMYDFLSICERYWHPDLVKFRDIHKGKRCFIVANGPSLKYEDLELLHKYQEITFAVNRVYMAFANTRWRPDYYVAEDPFILEQFTGELQKINCEKFISDAYKIFWERVNDNRTHKLYIGLAKDSYGNIKFSDDITKGCYCGMTVIYSCIQIAVYMGFSKIYLIGADCSYIGLPQSDGNHFYKEEHPGTVKAGDVRYGAMIEAYESAKRYADNHGVEIYNATRGGQLEVFERVDFDSLF